MSDSRVEPMSNADDQDGIYKTCLIEHSGLLITGPATIHPKVETRD